MSAWDEDLGGQIAPMAGILPTLLESGDFSDMTLVCEDKEFKIHQAVVCPQSPVIKKAVGGGFQESKDKRLSVAFDSETVQLMLDFMYGSKYLAKSATQPVPEAHKRTCKGPIADGSQHQNNAKGAGANAILNEKEGKVPAPSIESGFKFAELKTHLLVNAIANYYDVPKLGRLTRRNIGACVQREWRNQTGPDKEATCSFDEFFFAWRLIFEDTITGDKDLIRNMGKFAGARQLNILQQVKHMNMPPEFWLAYSQASSERHRHLKSSLAAIRRSLDQKDDLVRFVKEENGLLRKDLAHCNDVISLAAKTEARHNVQCHFRHGCHIESNQSTSPGELSLILKCDRCKCRFST